MSNASANANASESSLKIAAIKAALAAKKGEVVAPTSTLTDSIFNSIGRTTLKTSGVSAWVKLLELCIRIRIRREG